MIEDLGFKARNRMEKESSIEKQSLLQIHESAVG